MSTDDPQAELLNLIQAAKFTGLTAPTLRSYIAKGLLTGYRVGPRAIRVNRGELEALLHPIPTVERAA